jgi:DNA-binding Xre family transcriptional regulator
MENDPLAEEYLQEVYHILGSRKTSSFRTVVEERKKALGIASDHELSKMAGVPNNTLVRLIDEETQKVDLFNKLYLCKILGIDQSDILEHYIASLSEERTEKLRYAQRVNFIRRNFDIAAMKKMGFLKTGADYEAIERRIKTFFGLSSIFDYGKNLPATLFSRIKQYSKEDVRKMWVVAAVTQFQKLKKPYEYDREGLLALIPKIRLFSLDEEKGLVMVLRALYRVGVTVIIHKYLANTGVRGASFIVDGKPCVVLTDFRQRYSTLWFSLLHELYHIVFDYQALEQWKYHLSGDEGMTLTDDLFREELADIFARDRLLAKPKIDFIRPYIGSKAIVEQYAAKVKVHASIIYSFHCYNEKYNNGQDVYADYQHLFGNSEKAVRLVRLTPFDGDEDTSVLEKLELIEQVLTISNSSDSF